MKRIDKKKQQTRLSIYFLSVYLLYEIREKLNKK
jgi:hypothetical protein